MGEKLAKPPLIEAICELRVREARWTSDDVDRLFDRLGGEFSARGVAMDLNIDPETGTVSNRPRWQMKRPDAAAMVQLSPSVPPLSGAFLVNHLRPYDQWKTFREMIERARAGFVAAFGDVSVERVGLRYINDLPLGPSVRIRQVLEARPHLPPALAASGLLNLYQRCDLPQPEIDGILVHQVGLGAPKTDGSRGLFLDLDLGSTNAFSAADSTAILTWLDRAHERIGEAFAASITTTYFDQLRRGT